MFYKEWRQSQRLFIYSLVTVLIIGWFLQGIMWSGLGTNPSVAINMFTCFYCIVCACVALLLSNETVTKEYRDGTIAFLEMKPLSPPKLYLVKYIVGAVQSALIVVIPLILLRLVWRPLSVGGLVVVWPAEYSKLIVVVLFVTIASFSLMFLIRVCLGKRINRYLPLIIGIIYFFSLLRYFLGLSRPVFSTGTFFPFFPPLAIFSLAVALISIYLIVLALENRRIKHVMNEVIRFVEACAIALIIMVPLYLIASSIGNLESEFWGTSTLDSFLAIVWGWPLESFAPKLLSGLTPVICFLLPRLIYAAIAYYDARRRFGSLLSRALWAAFVLVFSIPGLIAYAFYRRKRKVRQIVELGGAL